MAISGGDGSIILTTKVDQTGLKKGLNTMLNMTAAVGKAFLVFSGIVASATAAVTKMAVSSYADYEQLVGGVETLFKNSSKKIIEYAEDAFFTAGISKNEYMQQVTSFAASLISSTAGDTEKAADIANMALMDISDNVNKMGSSMESVTLAYQGFAKQQYMLLDNLKLGYGGTKTEMERLLRDAEALTGVKYDINNLADVYSAIHAIQEELGITGTTAKEAEKTITGSANMTKAAWQNVLTAVAGGGDLDRAINNLVYSIRKYFENILPVVQRALIGIGKTVEQIAPLLVQNIASALIQAIPSLVNAVFQMIVGIAKGAWEGAKSLIFGGAKSVTAEINSNVGGISASSLDASNGMKKLGDETEKAGKKAKKSLANFDDLQILASNTTSGGGAEEIPVGNVGGGGGGMPQVEVSSAGDGGKGLIDGIDAMLTTAMGLAGDALVAIGLFLLFSGHPAWGIGFIIAGASVLGASAVAIGQSDLDFSSKLSSIITMASGLILAIGLILLFKAPMWQPLALGMIALGAPILGVAATEVVADAVGGQIGELLHGIIAIISGAFLAIGVIMMFGGFSPLALGMIIAGAYGLVNEIAVNQKAVANSLNGWLGGILAILGTGLLVIGIIMCATGQVTPLSIGLIISGAAGLASVVAINWNYVTETISNFIQENSALFVGIGIALVVLGIILIFTGVGLGLGLGLLLAGGASLAAVIAPNWDFIGQKIKEVWQGIMSFWENNIAPWFTLKKWGELAKNIVDGILNGLANLGKLMFDIFSDAWKGILSVFTPLGEVFLNITEGIVDVFKSVVNVLIDGINKVIGLPFEGLNGILERIYNLSFLGISPFRWLTWRAPVPKIPHLAKGAVIPGGREFLAVLGDQPRGQTNIEAPLDTIVEAMNIALQNNSNTSGGNTEIVLEIDGRELGRVNEDLARRENRIRGTRLVLV